MTPDLLIVTGLLVVTVVLFVSERFSVALVAGLVMATLMVTGVLTPQEGLSGFSSRATVTIAAMFMLSEGIRATGLLDRVGNALSRTGRGRPQRTLLVIMLVVGAVSAFINNTAAIAIFIPVVMSVAGRLKISPSRLLMPVSFASMLGGVCTLTGTSTNILVSEIALDHDLEGIGMFELAPVGLVFAFIGFVYLLTAARRLVPARRDSDGDEGGFDLKSYITDVVVREDSDLVGRPLSEDKRLQGEGIEVVDVFRGGQEVQGRLAQIEPMAGDILRLHGSAERIGRAFEGRGLHVRRGDDSADARPEASNRVLVEAVIAPDSPLAHRRLDRADFEDRYGALPLAFQHRGRIRRGWIGGVRLQPGDCLLLGIDSDRIEEMERDRAIVPVSRIERKRYRRDKTAIAVAVMAGVVGATALEIAPVVVNAIAGVIVMALTGCLRPDEGLRAVNWEVILLLAGMIPLGLALEKTGAAALGARTLADWLGAWGPQAVLGGLLLFTMLLTGILNNQAAAVLLAPMVIELAHGLGVDPRPFLIAVTFGASLSFITPVGYQTNTMIYGPGQYRFTDYFRVGAGLNLLLWIAGTLLIPLAWPFAP